MSETIVVCTEAHPERRVTISVEKYNAEVELAEEEDRECRFIVCDTAPDEGNTFDQLDEEGQKEVIAEQEARAAAKEE